MHDQLFITEVALPNLEHQNQFAIESKIFLNNRSDKRAFIKDAIRAGEILQAVIDNFIDALFDPELPKVIQYRTVYLHYLDSWNEAVETLKHVKPRLKCVVIDAEFFAKNYSPKASA